MMNAVTSCPSCGGDVLPGMRHCPACGNLLDEEAPNTPPSLGRLATLAPPPNPAPTSAWRTLTPFTLLQDRFCVKRTLKIGGMGAVYLAIDTSNDNRLCAVKEMLDSFAGEDEREEGREWFAREADMLAQLRHPSIPQIYDYFVEGGRYYLALEYLDGENLEDLLEHEGNPGLPEQRVMEWVGQLSEVLVYLHTYTPPIIFRDLKPANVMLMADGTIRLVDFGIARVFSAVRQGTMVGTPGYCPPEQFQGLAEPLSDLYALAATAHHLLTGRDPREAPPFNFPPVRSLAVQVSRATESLLQGALQLDTGQRGPSVEDFGRQARRIATDLAEGLVPSLAGSLAMHIPGDPLPPTQMLVPIGGLHFGMLATGVEHMVDFPIGNEGRVELRTTLRGSTPWLHVPSGQLRVASGTTVRVPLRIDATHLAQGIYRARIDLDGNGGSDHLAVEVSLRHWLFNPVNMLLAGAFSLGIVLVYVVRLLVLHG